MENATKALIIAAAILIAIVLISLGVFVLGQGTTLVKENSDMSDMEISTFNSKFEAYLGNNVAGSKAKQLINAIDQHNRLNTNNQITKAGITASNNINIGELYNIVAEYSKSGLMNKITISKAEQN